MSELHERIESLADLFIAGALEDGDRTNVETHAASCGSCAGVLNDARAFAAWARGSIAPDAPPADLEERIIARFRLAVPEKRQWIRNTLRSRFLKVAGWAAAAVFVISIGGSFSRPEGDRTPLLGDIPLLGTLFKAEKDDAREVTLALSESMKNLGDEYRLRLRAGDVNGDRVNDAILADRAGVAWNATAGKTVNYACTTPVVHLGYLGIDKENGDKPGDPGSAGLFERRLMGESEAKESAIGGTFSVEGLDDGRKSGKRESRAYIADLEPQVTTGAAGYDPTIQVQTVQPVQDNRKIIRNAGLDVEVESYEKTQAKINEIVAAAKGQVAGADTTRLANGKIQAVVTLRVPPEAFEAVLAKLRDLGTPRHESMSSQDITKAYTDLDIRLASKLSLLDRLNKVLAEAKGSVKELMEVHVQIGATVEEIERIKGELKYYDNLVGMATITLTVSEKDLGQPFEYVQTMNSNIGLTSAEIDSIYAKAQKVVLDAGGQVIDSKMTRQNDGSSNGTVQGRIDSEKFSAVREALRLLGHVDYDTVNVQQSARGGDVGTSKAGAPVRKEQALIAISMKTPPVYVSQAATLRVESPTVKAAYEVIQRKIEAAGGKIGSSNLSTPSADEASASIQVQVDIAKFPDLLRDAKELGKVKEDSVGQSRPPTAPDGSMPLIREQGTLSLTIVTPDKLIAPENAVGPFLRKAFGDGVNGVATSLKNLVVGVALAGPWILLAGLAWVFGRKLFRRSKPSA